jgi:hypothetical protein
MGPDASGRDARPLADPWATPGLLPLVATLGSMSRTTITTLTATTLAVVTAVMGCVDPEDILRDAGGPTDGGTFIPPGALEAAPGIYLTNATESDEPMPQPSSDPDAPVVIGGSMSNPITGVAQVTVETTTTIVEVHLAIDGRHFIIDPALVTSSGDVADIDACEILAAQQGYSCTQACLEACGCISCGQGVTEDAIEQACSVNCSIYSQQGLLQEAPWNGSEATFAKLVYEGYSENGVSVDGLLDQFPGCSSSSCTTGSGAAGENYSFGIIGVDYPSIPIIGPGVVQSKPASKPSLTSQDFTPPGGLSVGGCFAGECSPF